MLDGAVFTLPDQGGTGENDRRSATTTLMMSHLPNYDITDPFQIQRTFAHTCA
jgi:hypothetical protein